MVKRRHHETSNHQIDLAAVESQITAIEMQCAALRVSLGLERVHVPSSSNLPAKTIMKMIEDLRTIKRLTLREIGDHIGLSESQMSRVARSGSIKYAAGQLLSSLYEEGRPLDKKH